MRIVTPKLKPEDGDYCTACEDAISPLFHDLVDRAEQRVWSSEAVAKALLSLATANNRHRIGPLA